MRVSRVDLLKRLLAVSPGLTPKDTIQQSSCVVLRKGRFYTLNREIACSIKSGLDEEFTGAVVAKSIIDLLRKLNEDEIEIDIKDSQLILTGRNRTAKIVMESDVLLPLHSVELPKEWTKIHGDLALASALAASCTKKKSTHFSQCCVHIHPEWIEGSDNNKLGRWVIETPVKDSILVRGTTIKETVQLGLTKASETTNWLHFKNPYGLRISVRKWPVEQYPDFSKFLALRGEKVQFPKGLADAADRAGVFLDDTDGGVKVSISKSKVVVECQGMVGEYEEKRSIDYNGPSMTFFIPPKLVAELVEKQTQCEVSESCLRVANENYTYVTSLEVKE